MCDPEFISATFGPGNDEVIRMLFREDVLIPIIVASGIIAIVTVKSVASCIKTASRERTRREIAAFIAEGSISPEQGERLMKAGGNEA